MKKSKLRNPSLKIQNNLIGAMDKKIKEKNKGGRPTIYTEELGNKICNAIKNSVRGLDYICETNSDFPHPSTIREWIFSNKYPQFSEHYRESKKFQTDCMADEILEVAYNAKPHSRNGSVDKAKLQVGALQWIASHLKPKKWGDKVLDEEEKEERRQMTEEEIADKLNSVLDKAIKRKEENP